MSEHDCFATMNALLVHLEKGDPLAPSVEEELRHCEKCAAIIRRAEKLGTILAEPETPIAEASVETIASAAESEVARRNRRRLYVSGALVLLASIGVGIYAGYQGHFRHPAAISSLVAILLGGPGVLLMLSVRSGSPGRLFKRMEGRQISGVCRGIAEKLQVPLWAVRLVFVLLIFVHGIGLWGYLLLDIVMPIHPADRASLLRFRVARWWRGKIA